MTSNPFFVFHDDVFPAFAKNTAYQQRYPRSSFFDKTIVPANFFSSFEEFNHISTLKLKLNGTEKFQFEVDFQNNSRLFEERVVFEAQFFDGTSLLIFGIFDNGTLWMDSDYSNERLIFQSNASQLTEVDIFMSSTNESLIFEVVEEKFNFLYFFRILINI